MNNSRSLEDAIIGYFATNNIIPNDKEILEKGNQFRAIEPLQVSDSEFDKVIKSIHEKLRIDMGLGTIVTSNEHKEWIGPRKSETEYYYWDRYTKFLINTEGLSNKIVLGPLNQVTEQILDCCGDPKDTGNWSRRGLVMGDVQSGKTSTYTGLMCKAADHGYKLVILLTGTIETLRQQTQERLDEGFVGASSAGIIKKNKELKPIGVGAFDQSRRATVFTSTINDFKINIANNLNIKLDNLPEPTLLVVKKNKTILENLTKWLEHYNANSENKINIPLLMIDDEADNASVTTNPEEATAINKAIRNLLKIFPRSSYLGFTATPFANVFIDPDTENEMLGDDLFPKDFIYGLEAPTNYIGSMKIFNENSNLNCIRAFDLFDESDLPLGSNTKKYNFTRNNLHFLNGYRCEEIFPRNIKSNHCVENLPDSLIESVGCFLLAVTIMDLRELPKEKHRSMLVNISQFTEVQNQTKEQLLVIIEEMKQDIRSFSKLSEQEALKNGTISFLKNIFEIEYKELEFKWIEVQNKLHDAVSPIYVWSVNGSRKSEKLNYEKYKDHGLRVIAIGGNSLSRGLTLKGLVVSYFYRHSRSYDTLLQMGRWFGYRKGYEDIFRVWMTEEARTWFEDVSMATEELRQYLIRMYKNKQQPKEFGIRVRSHPGILQVTARNKMRNSYEIEISQRISESIINTNRLDFKESTLRNNFFNARTLVEKIQLNSDQKNGDKIFFENINGKLIIEFLENFITTTQGSQLHKIAEHIKTLQLSNELTKWDLLIPQGRQSNSQIQISNNITIYQEARNNIRTINKELIEFSQRGLNSGNAFEAGMNLDQIESAQKEFEAMLSNHITGNYKPTKAQFYCKFRISPLMILRFIEPGLEKNAFPESQELLKKILKEKIPLIGISLFFPRLSEDLENVKYRVNEIERRNAMPLDELPGDDEELDEIN